MPILWSEGSHGTVVWIKQLLEKVIKCMPPANIVIEIQNIDLIRPKLP